MGGPGQRALDFLVAGAFDHRDLHCSYYRVLLLDCSCWSDGGDLAGFGLGGVLVLGGAINQQKRYEPIPETRRFGLIMDRDQCPSMDWINEG